MKQKSRLLFVFLAMASLIAGMLAGLHRIGWSVNLYGITTAHGAIMVGGFIGTLISLEKIIPLRKKIWYIIPGISGASLPFFFSGLPAYGIVCLILAATGLSAVFLVYLIRERSLIYGLMFTGALCWLTGNIYLLGSGFYPTSVPWWMAFALLIIAAERLELMKFLPVRHSQKIIFYGAIAFLLAGCVASFHDTGKYTAGLGLIVAASWLMRYDVVALNLKKSGLPKFIGTALLTGYIALMLSGIFLLSATDTPMGYDVLVHSFFIGFVFSMIFAHGPVILPGVLGVSAKPFHPVLYGWLALLHVSWLMRIAADFFLNFSFRLFTGAVSAVAITGYFLSMAVIFLRSHEK